MSFQDPVEYPHFDLYPVPTGEVESVKISPPVALPTVHPWLSLCKLFSLLYMPLSTLNMSASSYGVPSL